MQQRNSKRGGDQDGAEVENSPTAADEYKERFLRVREIDPVSQIFVDEVE